VIMNSANDNEGLIGPDGVTVAKRAYVLGNYSKFVRPGFYRIDATPTTQAGVSVSAYRNSSTGVIVIVAINNNGGGVSETFTLNGKIPASVTPWITCTSLDLVQQADVPVSGDSFSYNLPGSSVTTFVVNTGVAPPTGLKAIAQ
jgi:glucuronoarabinoxylan endo-1,4-beta-xylanase